MFTISRNQRKAYRFHCPNCVVVQMTKQDVLLLNVSVDLPVDGDNDMVQSLLIPF
jgi:hypothetical protein